MVNTLPAYTLGWWLEQKFKIPLKMDKDLELILRKGSAESNFPVYCNTNEEDIYQRWILVGNKSGNGFLIPEQKVVDYYLKLEGEIERNYYLSVLNTLKEIPGMQHYFDVKPETLKSRINLSEL